MPAKPTSKMMPKAKSAPVRESALVKKVYVKKPIAAAASASTATSFAASVSTATSFAATTSTVSWTILPLRVWRQRNKNTLNIIVFALCSFFHWHMQSLDLRVGI